MATEITLVRGDHNFYMEFAIYNADGEGEDLTNCTQAVMRIQRYGQSTITSSIYATDGGDIISDTIPGTVQLLVTGAHVFMNYVAEYRAELELLFSEGRVVTCPEIYVEVIADLPV